ncbi:MAG: N-acetylneuraminate synthase [Candidatus Pacebacteria bacterium]|nr:N-acetylneuraminate synthase [Candidatus Paceibacterota bacterium]
MHNSKTYIIAEAGVNHNGSIELAEKLIVQAAAIGADAIKFQTFQSNKIVHPKAAQAEYQQKNSKSNTQYELLEKLELSKEQFLHLKKIADLHHIQFLSTPFDLESLDFLVEMDLPYIKISSGDLTYGPLLLKTAQYNKKIFLSTGMATIAEIKEALFVLAYGYANPSTTPQSLDDIIKFSNAIDWKMLLRDKVTLFHCTSEYPAPFQEINLNVLETFKEEFGLELGYSDHSLGLMVPHLAVAKGARVIEKHFTLDNALEGPDHKASLNLEQFSEMIKQIRLTEAILGNDQKGPTVSEIKNKTLVRRGVYITNKMAKNHIFSENDLICLRPISCLSPMKYWDILGTVASRDFEKLDSLDD